MNIQELDDLREQAENQAPDNTVAIYARTLLELLTHIDFLRSEITRVNHYVVDEELEQESYSSFKDGWNQALSGIASSLTVDLDDEMELSKTFSPLRKRAEEAEARISRAVDVIERRRRETGTLAQVNTNIMLGILVDPVEELPPLKFIAPVRRQT